MEEMDKGAAGQDTGMGQIIGLICMDKQQGILTQKINLTVVGRQELRENFKIRPRGVIQGI